MNARPVGDDLDIDERLNAYVDGELCAAGAAEIAALITHDRTLARRVATLTRLKAELAADRQPAPALDLPGPRRPARRLRARPIAATLLAAAAGLVVGFFLWNQAAGPHAPGIWDRHDRWAAQPVETASSTERRDDPDASAGSAGGLLHARLAEARHELYLPDLSAARLMLVHTAFIAGPDGGAMLHAGYLGSRGCRVSLFMLDGPTEGTAAGTDPIAAATAAARSTDAVRSWRVEDMRYLVMARGMDPEHFDTVAATIRRLTIERQAPDDDTALVLAQSRAAAPPCRA